MDLNNELIEKSDFSEIATRLTVDKNYLKEAARLKEEGKYWIITDRDSNEPYLIRYYYMNLRPFARIVIHHILKSDRDGLHDHPWAFQNYILSGGYWEHTLEGKFWRRAGYGACQTCHFLHRLELNPSLGEETWTLFLMGPQEKEWGFINENGIWEQWDHYLNRKRN